MGYTKQQLEEKNRALKGENKKLADENTYYKVALGSSETELEEAKKKIAYLESLLTTGGSKSQEAEVRPVQQKQRQADSEWLSPEFKVAIENMEPRPAIISRDKITDAGIAYIMRNAFEDLSGNDEAELEFDFTDEDFEDAQDSNAGSSGVAQGPGPNGEYPDPDEIGKNGELRIRRTS